MLAISGKRVNFNLSGQAQENKIGQRPPLRCREGKSVGRLDARKDMFAKTPAAPPAPPHRTVKPRSVAGRPTTFSSNTNAGPILLGASHTLCRLASRWQITPHVVPLTFNANKSFTVRCCHGCSRLNYVLYT